MKYPMLIALTFALPMTGCGRTNEQDTSPTSESRTYFLAGMPAKKYYEQFFLAISGTCPNDITYKQAISDRQTVGADARGSPLTAQIRLFLMPDGNYLADYTELARDQKQPGGFDWANGSSVQIEGKWTVDADRLILVGFGSAIGISSDSAPAFNLNVSADGIDGRVKERTFTFKMNASGYNPFSRLNACNLSQ